MTNKYDLKTMGEIENLYGTKLFDETYTPANKPKSGRKLYDKAVTGILEKLSIDSVVREVSFAVIAMITYAYIFNKGILANDSLIGYFSGVFLVIAIVYNLFKASIHSLAPGLFLLAFSAAMTYRNTPLKNLEFLTPEVLNYMIGIGAFYVAISLLKTPK